MRPHRKYRKMFLSKQVDNGLMMIPRLILGYFLGSDMTISSGHGEFHIKGCNGFFGAKMGKIPWQANSRCMHWMIIKYHKCKLGGGWQIFKRMITCNNRVGVKGKVWGGKLKDQFMHWQYMVIPGKVKRSKCQFISLASLSFPGNTPSKNTP